MPFIKNVGIFTRKVTPDVAPKTPNISAGELFNLATNISGSSFGWGDNSFGNLGINNQLTRFTPTSILGSTKTFCHISTGITGRHSVAIDKNGQAWGWGNNSQGQIGNNSTINRSTPVSVAGGVKTFCKISAGANYTLAIDKNGRAWGWGNNSLGRLGDTSITARCTPVSVAGAVKTFCQITAGGGTSHVIDKNGRAWGWGENGVGQIGDNSITSRTTPVSVAGAVKTFCKISTGNEHTLAIDKNGRLWSWGWNIFGQLGTNNTINRVTPVSILGAVKTFCEISSGQFHSAAIDKNGRAWGWGNNNSGELGDNSVSSRLTPVSVRGAVKTFCKISTGDLHTIAIDKNNNVWSWGNNQDGQLGDGTATRVCTPVSVRGTVKTFCKISTGNNHTIVIDKNGRAWGWGLNNSGQLGNLSYDDRCTPISVLGATKIFCQIYGSDSHTVAIDNNGRAWAWGSNSFGEIGDNSLTQRLTPVSVLGAVKTFCKIGASQLVTNAIDKNGRAWSWGAGFFATLGDNQTATSRLTPVSVLGATKTFCEISSGTGPILVIDKNGRVWAWGSNQYGKLGDNSTTTRLTPVSIGGATKTFCKISAGQNHSLAIDKNGQVWSWGVNFQGQLGDFSNTSRLTPVSVRGTLKTFCKIAAGISSYGIDQNGQVWSWGDNSSRQLGDFSNTSRLTPVSVRGAKKTFCEIYTGAGFVVAIDKNGRSWAWGAGTIGQLGNASSAKYTPVRVCVI
jgi:alpha-tubulin suppressor-like RCC1 family protein